MEVPGLLALFAQNIKLTNGSLIARSACASEIPPACSSPQIWPCLIVLPRGACIYSAGTVLFLFLPPGTVFFLGLVVGATQWPRSGACLPACLSVCLSVFLFLFFFFFVSRQLLCHSFSGLCVGLVWREGSRMQLGLLGQFEPGFQRLPTPHTSRHCVIFVAPYTFEGFVV